MSSKCATNPKILTRNPKTSGSLGSNFNKKSQKRIKEHLLVSCRRPKHQKLIEKMSCDI